MKKYLFKILLLGLLPFCFFACSDDDEEIIRPPKISTSGLYILNQGLSKGDNTKLSFYDFETQTLSKDVFKNQNGIVLGDTGQDILIYGSKMYISVTYSKRIYVTDLQGKLLKTVDNKDAIITLRDGEIAQKPYALIPHEGKIYATYYGGCVARIDTTSFNIDKTVALGSNPERMVIVNNNLYITNRNGDDGTPSYTVSKVDLASFNIATPITVGLNPIQICADKTGNIFVGCAGNYDNIKPAFHKIAANTTKSEVINDKSVVSMAFDKNKNRILLIYSLPITYKSKFAYYDLTKNEFVDKSYLEGEYPEATNITLSPIDNTIYLNTSHYPESAKLNMFTAEGKLIKSIKTEGDFPTGVYFVTKNN